MTPSEPLAHGVSIRPTWTTKPSPSPDRNALTSSGKEAAGFRGRIAPLRSNLPCPRPPPTSLRSSPPPVRIFASSHTSPCAYLPWVGLWVTIPKVRGFYVSAGQAAQIYPHGG